MIRTDFNASEAADAIRKAIAQLSDMRPLFQDVTEYMIEATRQRFAKGIDPQGNAWAAKAQSTLDRYKRMGYGKLPRPLIGAGRRLSREIVGEATRDGSVIGSALIYSRVMQEGAEKGAFGADRRGHPIPWGRIPARVWLDISAEDERQIIDIADEHLAEHLPPGG